MKYKALILIITCINSNIYAPAMINLILQPYPTFFPEEHAQRVTKKLAKPGSLARTQYKLVAGPPPTLAGVIATYGGYSTESDESGLISFPLLHETPEVTLVITSLLTPIMMAGNTVHHWELEQGTPAELYRVKQTKDPISKIDVVSVESIAPPENMHLEPQAFIIVARPKDFFVPTGSSIAKQSPHFFIPDIYLKKTPDATFALYVLQVTQYFGALKPKYKEQPTWYQRQIAQ